MEEFLPGLLKMMEQRLGNKPTSIFLCIIVVGISSWMLRLFWENLVWPIVILVKRLLEGSAFTWEQFTDIVFAIFSLVLVISMVVLVAGWRAMRRERKMSQKVQAIFEQRYPEMKENMKVIMTEVKATILKAYAKDERASDKVKAEIMKELSILEPESGIEDSQTE